ncbi:ribosomal protein S18-alanine N-acetyltransferase [Nocardioides sp.]|uniref:ribosomal protein S18-alanine N-acetyltransferase n=1 Tax=Nocardioides sp. TaxID=35761 RepID=UPI003D13065D
MIRAATGADAEAIASLELTLFGVDAWSLDQVRDELSGPGRAALVAEEDQVVGYLITRLVDDVSDLQRIGVHPERQRQGLAAALLAEALARPAARMLLEVAQTNAAARAFYARAGFVEIHRRPRYYRDGSDALVLQRTGAGTMVP